MFLLYSSTHTPLTKYSKMFTLLDKISFISVYKINIHIFVLSTAALYFPTKDYLTLLIYSHIFNILYLNIAHVFVHFTFLWECNILFMMVKHHVYIYVMTLFSCCSILYWYSLCYNIVIMSGVTCILLDSFAKATSVHFMFALYANCHSNQQGSPWLPLIPCRQLNC